jgi:5-dehydro-2-deoxygluconokinase
MGESFMPFYNHFIDFVKKNPSIKLAFNPGTHQLRAGVESLRPALESTHIIYVNREEAEKLTAFGDSHGRDKEILKALSQLGPKVTIITDGANGSLLYDSESQKSYKCAVMPVDAYERTGAGDAFGSAFLAAVIKGKNYQDALLWGTINSASVIGYVGSQKGLLKENELPNWMERAKSSGTAVVEI